jgi:hypothetical protein
VGPRAALSGPPTGVRARTVLPVTSRHTDLAIWVTTSCSSLLRGIYCHESSFISFVKLFLLHSTLCVSWTDYVRDEVLLRVKEKRNILHEVSKRKANWIGRILRRNCLLQQVTEGKIKGGIEVTGR